MQSTLLSAFRSDPFNYEKWFDHLPKNSEIKDPALPYDVSQEFLKKAGLQPEHFRATGFNDSLAGLAYSEVASIAKRTGLDPQNPLFIDQASVASSLYNLIGKSVNNQVLDAACVLNAIHLAQNDPIGKSSFPRSLLPANTLTKVILFAKAEKDSLFKDTSKNPDDDNSVAEDSDENDEKMTLSEFLVSKTPDAETASLGLIPAILESENNSTGFLGSEELEEEKKYILSELNKIGHSTLWGSTSPILSRHFETDPFANLPDSILDPSTLSVSTSQKLLKAFPDIAKLDESTPLSDNQTIIAKLAKLYTGKGDSLADTLSTLSTPEETTLFLEYAKKLEIQDYLLTQALKTDSNIAIKDLTFSAGRNVKGLGLKDYLYLMQQQDQIEKVANLIEERKKLEKEKKELETDLKQLSNETAKVMCKKQIQAKQQSMDAKNQEIKTHPLTQQYAPSLIMYFKKHLTEESSLKRAKEAMNRFWDRLGQYSASDMSGATIGPKPADPQEIIRNLLEELSRQERVRG